LLPGNQLKGPNNKTSKLIYRHLADSVQLMPTAKTIIKKSFGEVNPPSIEIAISLSSKFLK
jgi:hypothetical protein